MTQRFFSKILTCQACRTYRTFKNFAAAPRTGRYFVTFHAIYFRKQGSQTYYNSEPKKKNQFREISFFPQKTYFYSGTFVTFATSGHPVAESHDAAHG